MSITASALYANARSVVGLNFDDGRLDDNNLVGALNVINAGLMELSMVHDWDWLYSEGTVNTQVGFDSTGLPTNHLRTIWLALDDEPLIYKSRKDHIKYRGRTARPRYYSIFKTSYYLSPTPDDAYLLAYGCYTHLPKVTANSISNLSSTTLQIPDRYQGLAALYIAKHICLMLKDYNGYKAVEQEIANQRKVMDDNVLRSTDSRAPQTRGDA